MIYTIAIIALLVCCILLALFCNFLDRKIVKLTERVTELSSNLASLIEYTHLMASNFDMLLDILSKEVSDENNR